MIPFPELNLTPPEIKRTARRYYREMLAELEQMQDGHILHLASLCEQNKESIDALQKSALAESAIRKALQHGLQALTEVDKLMGHFIDQGFTPDREQSLKAALLHVINDLYATFNERET